jgi:hypothetical protein
MSNNFGDYYGANSGAPSCFYASLSDYTSNYDGGVRGAVATLSGTKIVVPQWGPSAAYESLNNTINQGMSCSGYGTIDNAYGNGSANCQSTYRSTLCGCNGR